MKKDESIKIITYCLVGNALLLLLKGTVGLLTGSQALKADAVNSGGDVIVSFVVLLGLRYALKPYDKGHNYGHDKMEALLSMLMGFVILIGIVFLLIDTFLVFTGKEAAEPSLFALGVALISIFIKAIIYRKTKVAGKKLASIVITTIAKDQKNDIFVSLCTVAAILLSFAGQWLGVSTLQHYSEPIFVVAMSVFIIKVAIEIIYESSSILLDAAPANKIVNGIRRISVQTEGVEKLNWVKCRKMGRGILVDVAVEVDGGISVKAGHAISDSVKSAIIVAYPQVIDVLVHINPTQI